MLYYTMLYIILVVIILEVRYYVHLH